MNDLNDHAEHQTNRQNIVTYAMYFALLIIGVCIILILYWFYQPSDVLKFKTEPIPVRTIRDHPSGGGVVILKADYCKLVAAKGIVRTSFRSSSREIFLPPSEDKQPKQCLNTEVPIIIPKDIVPDTYRVHIRVDYTVNPLRHMIEEVDSKPFTVVGM